MQWYRTVMTRHYADFGGRARRAEYWMFFLFYILIFIAAAIVDVILGLWSIQSGIGLLSGIVALAHFVPSIALGVRRLHDRDMSGWWMLLALVPLANLALLILFMLDGTAGPNRFGADPKGRAAPAMA
ncbi:MAG: DUF805 domain-containing protein [Paracoccaceae bacterium]